MQRLIILQIQRLFKLIFEARMSLKFLSKVVSITDKNIANGGLLN